MSSLPNYYLSPEEYLTVERSAEFKSEYFDGVVYAMAGGSERHNLITGNLVTELNIRLRERPCRVYPSDMKVRVPNSKRFFYPDVSVICGETRFADEMKDVILNPVLVAEVGPAAVLPLSRKPSICSPPCASGSRCQLRLSMATACCPCFTARRSASACPCRPRRFRRPGPGPRAARCGLRRRQS